VINVEVGHTFFYGEMLKGIHISKSSVLENITWIHASLAKLKLL
jgi:hypothetical protein